MQHRFIISLFHLTAILILLTGVSILGGGCSQNDAQRKFEEHAFSEPENYTKTNVSGEIQEEDEDDWRIAPMFQGLIRVQNPAFPNPVNAGQEIEIELNIIGIETISSIIVRTRNENNNWQRIAYNSSPETGLNVFRIDPVDFTYTDNYENAIGLHRVFFFDSNDNLITYGDVKIE